MNILKEKVYNSQRNKFLKCFEFYSLIMDKVNNESEHCTIKKKII